MEGYEGRTGHLIEDKCVPIGTPFAFINVERAVEARPSQDKNYPDAMLVTIKV